MKKTAIYLCALLACCLAACSDNDEIGYVEPWEDEYVLPQGKSDADDRIVAFHEQYGTYILYEYSYLDFRYELTALDCELPNPACVGDMLDFLNDIWFNFYPDDFKKKYLPLKIFLAESISSPSSGEYRCVTKSSCVGIGYCRDTLREFAPKGKLEFKQNLQIGLWSIYLESFEIPEEFFEISSYTSAADMDPESENYAQKRGFVDMYEFAGGEYGVYSYPWYMMGDWETGEIDKNNDLYSFIKGMILRTSADWEEDLKWPLVKQKYDLLRNWIQEVYGVDLQKIGDETYE